MRKKDLTAESTSKYAQVGSHRLHYHEAGEGVPLVMLHGGGPGAGGWSNFSRNIGPFSEKYRTILLDQPGFGKSDKPEMSGALGETFARIINDFLDVLRIERAHFLGNSMGGLVSTKLALMFPERANRLVLMGPAAGVSFASPMPTEGRKMMVDYYSKAPSEQRLREFLNTLMYDPSVLTDAEFAARYRASSDDEAEQWYKAHMFSKGGGGLVLEEYWRDFEKVKHKTLLIWGRDDRVCPLDRALFMLQRMPDVRLCVFDKCGHWAQMEKADLFNRLSLDFLENG